MGLGLQGSFGSGAAVEQILRLVAQKKAEQQMQIRAAELAKQQQFENELKMRGAAVNEGTLGVSQNRLGLDVDRFGQEKTQYADAAPMRLANLQHVGAQTLDLQGKPQAATTAFERAKELEGLQFNQSQQLSNQRFGNERSLIGDRGAQDRLTDAAKPKPTPNAGADDDLVETVIDNPALFDRLTATVQGRIAGPLRAKGFEGFGKPLPETAIVRLAETKAAISSLQDLRKTLTENEQYIGPLAGLQGLNPYSEARKAQANIDLVRQRVGKALEGGVLRKEDEEKYKKILSTLRDTPDTAVFKVDNLIDRLTKDMDAYTAEQRLAGRKVNAPAGPAPPAGGGVLRFDPVTGRVIR
jgi:hypothetical protein